MLFNLFICIVEIILKRPQRKIFINCMCRFILIKTLLKLSAGNSLFKYLKSRYEKKHLNQLDELLKCRRKLQNLNHQNNFLDICIVNKVCPTFMFKRIVCSKLKCSPITERMFLKDEIRKNNKLKEKLKYVYSSILNTINFWISELDKLRFFRHMISIDYKVKEKQRRRHDKSIRFLISKRFGSLSESHGCIHNFSKKVLNKDESRILKLGLKYSVPNKKTSRETVFSNFESLAAQISHHKAKTPELLNSLNAKLCDYAHSYCSMEVDLGDFRMSRECKNAYKTLKEDLNIIISKPDKGAGVVILDRVDYNKKMMDILKDTTKFMLIGKTETFDLTAKIEQAFQRKMLVWLRKNHINTENYNRIRPVGSQRPKLYGLPKVHKEGCPLRPILSMVGSPQHKLAKFLIDLLAPILHKFSAYTVKDSFEFVEKLHELSPTDGFMVSYDIKSLFTNVPLVEIIEICSRELYHSNVQCPSIPESVFQEMMKMATVGVEFSFNGLMYRQIDGICMGSPLGPILANIFVGYYERKLFKGSVDPKMYVRYMDDTFVIFKNKECSDEFLKSLFNLHPSLKYTKEDEKQRTISFLDVSVQRNDNGKYKTRTYRKSKEFSSFVPWSSFCPKKTKLGVLVGAIKRSTKICSPEHLNDELKTIKNIFSSLGYPGKIIDIVVEETTSLKSIISFSP